MTNSIREFKMKIFYKAKSKALGVAGLEKWKNSFEGLRFQLEHCLDSESRKKVRSKLAKLLARAQHRHWEAACEKAWGYDHKTGKAQLRLGSAAHLLESERLSLQALHVPPHWKVVGDCSTCGPVVLKFPGQPCPWCATSFASDRQRLLQQSLDIIDSLLQASPVP